MKRTILMGLAAAFAVAAGAVYAQDTEKKPPSYVKAGDVAAWVILSKKPVKEGLFLMEKGDEGDNAPTTKDGKEAWMTLGVNKASGPDAGALMYFKTTKKDLKNGVSPKIKIIIEYYDEGEAEVGLEYDSSDDAVAKCPIPGAFKDSEEKITIENTKKWKTFTFEIEDARLNNGCNGNDFRFNVPAGFNFIVGSIAIVKVK